MNNPTFRKSSYSATESHCIEVADAPALHAVRDSKTPSQRPLSFTPAEWHAFLHTTKR